MAWNISTHDACKGQPPHTVYAATTASTTALAAKSTRKYLLLQNNSATDIFFRLDAGTAHATDGTSLKLAASGGSFEMTVYVSVAALTVIHAGVGTKNLTIVEG